MCRAVFTSDVKLRKVLAIKGAKSANAIKIYVI